MYEPYMPAIHLSNNSENDPIQTLWGGLSVCPDRVYVNHAVGGCYRPEADTYQLDKTLTWSTRSPAPVLHQESVSACAKPRDGEISLIITIYQ